MTISMANVSKQKSTIAKFLGELSCMKCMQHTSPVDMDFSATKKLQENVETFIHDSGYYKNMKG
jgi:hypothetical protein